MGPGGRAPPRRGLAGPGMPGDLRARLASSGSQHRPPVGCAPRAATAQSADSSPRLAPKFTSRHGLDVQSRPPCSALGLGRPDTPPPPPRRAALPRTPGRRPRSPARSAGPPPRELQMRRLNCSARFGEAPRPGGRSTGRDRRRRRRGDSATRRRRRRWWWRRRRRRRTPAQRSRGPTLLGAALQQLLRITSGARASGAGPREPLPVRGVREDVEAQAGNNGQPGAARSPRCAGDWQRGHAGASALSLRLEELESSSAARRWRGPRAGAQILVGSRRRPGDGGPGQLPALCGAGGLRGRHFTARGRPWP